MAHKLRSLAMIRKNEADPCPFGLDIPIACNTVGDLIDKMAPLEILGPDASSEEKDEIIEANKRLLRWQGPGMRCKYAGRILEPHTKAVECNWGEEDAGDQEAALVGSPNYSKQFSGIGLDGLYTIPLGYYTDNSIDRGFYYGQYSIESIAQDEDNSEAKTEESANKAE